MAHEAWLINPSTRTVEPVPSMLVLTPALQEPVPEWLLEAAARQEGVPVAHYYGAARLLGARSALGVAPYTVRKDGQVQSVLWALEGVSGAEHKREPGFRLLGYRSKWVKLALLVRYQRKAPLPPLPLGELGIEFIAGRAGGTRGTFRIEFSVLPADSAGGIACSRPGCSRTESELGRRMKKCARCGVANYCSDECASAHWVTGHKVVCREQTTTLVRPRDPLTTCARCGTEAPEGQQLKVCGRCKQAKYCSKECQRAHWGGMHRMACQP